jgi:hypothetical protein
LVAAVREALELRRLKLAKRPDGTPIDHATTLKNELLNFRVKITAAANETFSAREGLHDDLVLSVALPIWLASLPRFEMSGSDVIWRPKEQVAVEADSLARLRVVEEEEAEAWAREKGIETPAMKREQQAVVDELIAEMNRRRNDG